jgi:hypothetical protein
MGCEAPSIAEPCSVRVVQRVIPNHLSIYQSIYLSISLSIYLSVYQSISLSDYQTIRLSVYLSIYLSSLSSGSTCEGATQLTPTATTASSLESAATTWPRSSPG